VESCVDLGFMKYHLNRHESDTNVIYSIYVGLLPDKDPVLKIHKKEGSGDQLFWSRTGRMEAVETTGRSPFRTCLQGNGGLVRRQWGPSWLSTRASSALNEGLISPQRGPHCHVLRRATLTSQRPEQFNSLTVSKIRNPLRFRHFHPTSCLLTFVQISAGHL